MKIFGISLFEYIPPKYCKKCGEKIIKCKSVVSEYNEKTGKPIEYLTRYVCDRNRNETCYDYSHYTKKPE